MLYGVWKINQQNQLWLIPISTSTSSVSNKPCNCTGICFGDGRCNCNKAGRKCTNQCHSKNEIIKCQNKDVPPKTPNRKTKKNIENNNI